MDEKNFQQAEEGSQLTATDAGKADAQAALTIARDFLTTLTRINDQVHEQKHQISSLRHELSSLREGDTFPTQQRRGDVGSSEARSKASQAWSEIKAYNLASDTTGLLNAYTSREQLPLTHLFSPGMAWNSWAYRRSFPALARFLDPGFHAPESPELSIKCTDKTENNKIIVRRSQDAQFDYQSVWFYLCNRFTESLEEGTISDGSHEDGQGWSLAKLRIMKVTDISPLLSAMFMASTQVHLSIVAQFLERHLCFSNWANMALKQLRSQTLNNLTIEYHIAFYSFSTGHADRSSSHHKRDTRGVRRIASFGPDEDLSSGQLYEEQRSFLYVGLGVDWGTCFQLSERPRASSMSGFGFDEAYYDGPSAVFLAWLYAAMRHARFRWEKAIDALNSVIDTPSNIVFIGENTDLLADDPSFSKSRTYFWAIQVYKMFERRLEETICTWEQFIADYEYELHDGIIPELQVEFHLKRVNKNIDALRDLLATVRKKQGEVESLQRGLFGASALFDSRSAVRQGDNIQLLTYVTIFFLPLTFCTSIFGMQVVFNSLPVKAFIISMPTLFVATVLVVSNLETITYYSSKSLSYSTKHLRRMMRDHDASRWHATERALHHDKLSRRAPNRKVPRQASLWTYAAFAMDFVVVQLPVREFNRARRTLQRRHTEKREADTASQEPSRAARVLAFKEGEKLMRRRRWRQRLGSAAEGVWTTVRMLVLPLWLPSLLVQYVTHLALILMRDPSEHVSPTPRPSLHTQALQRVGLFPPTPTPTTDALRTSSAPQPAQRPPHRHDEDAGFRVVEHKEWSNGRGGVSTKRKRWKRAVRFQASGLNARLPAHSTRT